MIKLTESEFCAKVTAECLELFWSKVKILDSEKCWEWIGLRGHRGYGIFKKFGQPNKRAHRIAFGITHGKIDRALFVCHKCDNPSCVNPGHLFQGTALENTMDALNKGRLRGFPKVIRTWQIGENHWSKRLPERVARGDRSGRHTKPEKTARGDRSSSSKIKEADIAEIKRLRSNGLSYSKISQFFPIKSAAIGHIIRGRNWKHAK